MLSSRLFTGRMPRQSPGLNSARGDADAHRLSFYRLVRVDQAAELIGNYQHARAEIVQKAVGIDPRQTAPPAMPRLVDSRASSDRNASLTVVLVMLGWSSSIFFVRGHGSSAFKFDSAMHTLICVSGADNSGFRP